MTDLIKELDHGLSALPAGSQVVFANMHPADESLGVVLQNVSLEYIKVGTSVYGLDTNSDRSAPFASFQLASKYSVQCAYHTSQPDP